MPMLRLTFMFSLNSLSKIKYVKTFSIFVISLGRVVVPSPKIVKKKTFPGPMRIYPVKKNPIGSAVSEIRRFRQTSCYFSARIISNSWNAVLGLHGLLKKHSKSLDKFH